MGKPRSINFDVKDYDYWVKEYIRKSELYGKAISSMYLRKDEFNLPDSRWYVKNCPDKTITSWSEFIDWCGFISKGKTPSKEKMTHLIYKMQNEIGRPLMYDDFRGIGCYHPPIKFINLYWGTINNMKKELGLEIIKDSMLDRSLSKEEFDAMIIDICSYVKNDGRNFITTSEIDNNNNWLNADSLRKTSKKYYNCDLQELLGEHDVSLGKQGRGTIFNFEDGEHVTSQFEYMFSKYLREFGLKYTKDYQRDVDYSSFISKYNGRMNCDYVINIKEKKIYIEIAGIIEAYKSYFFSNKAIKASKSKENYRQKLLQKQSMLKENNLNYFILFPCDLTKENVYEILNNDSVMLRKNIESFIKNNIDWQRVSECGELKYLDEIKWGRNVIDYKEVV